MLDRFIQLIEGNNFQPEDIEEVVAQPHPVVQFRAWRENTLRTSEDYCFYSPYLFACAAYRITPARWHDPEVRNDPKIRDFMQRVRFSSIIDEEDYVLAQLEDPKAFLMRIELTARGKKFKEKIPYAKGRWTPDEFRNTDEELVKKFSDNASRVLTSDRAQQVAKTILELEKLDNVGRVMEALTP
ncbi:hypothetical protein ACFLX3_02630 [Chloroflexota bacterium]